MAQRHRTSRRAAPVASGFHQEGVASYYADRFEGRPTASGEPFRQAELTAAHRTLPFGTCVLVTAAARHVRVRINDRGPFGRAERIIDLSRRGAEQLDMIRAGVLRVQIDAVPCDGPAVR